MTLLIYEDCNCLYMKKPMGLDTKGQLNLILDAKFKGLFKKYCYSDKCLIIAYSNNL